MLKTKAESRTRKFLFVMTVPVILSIFGCASVIKGNHDTVAIHSMEKGTYIYVDGIKAGVDDVLAQVKRGETHTIKVTKKGCEDLVIQTGKSFDATSLLGVFIDFGIVTIPVDLLSGSAWKTEPTIYNVTPICNPG